MDQKLRTPLRSAPLQQILQEKDRTLRRADDRFNAAHSAENCKLCNSGPHIPFSMAFQPIVDVRAGGVIAYEALVRGPEGEPAGTILNETLHNHRYSIDQRCREKAITASSTLGILETDADLSVNFYPNAVYQPRQCLQRTFNAAQSVDFPLQRIIFEITEVEQVDHDHLRDIMTEYRTHGLRIAIDDFGAGHSGLSLLTTFQPDIIKLDQALVHRVHERSASRSIVRSIVSCCRELGIQIIAEGIELEEEMRALCELDIFIMQGFYFAAPMFEQLPVWPGLERALKTS